MSDGNRDNGRRFGRKRFGEQDKPGDGSKRSDDRNREENRQHEPPPTCRLCGKPIFDLSSAMSDAELDDPVHFDCALARMSERESLTAREKIVYIGAGNFAVVEFRDSSETAFSVKRRISFEKEGAKHEWRGRLSSRISELGIMNGAIPGAPVEQVQDTTSTK